MQVYDVAVFGATVLSASLANKLGKKIIVIEKSESVATDYVSCINTRLAQVDETSIPEIQEFKQEFIRRNLISEDNTIHIYPLTGICARYLQKSNVLLATDIISIEFLDNVYEITLFNIDGFTKIKANNILDTTPCGIYSAGYRELSFAKYLNAVVIGNIPPKANNLFKDRFNQFVFSLQIDNCSSYSGAVNLMCKTWEQAVRKEYSDFKLVTIAPQFAYIFEAPVTYEVQTNYIHKPSASYVNLGKAFEEGIYAAQLYL